MLFIHHTTCISPQPADFFAPAAGPATAGPAPGEPAGTGPAITGPATAGPLTVDPVTAGPVDGVYTVVEPPYDGLPANVLRRMSKAVRFGVGAALPLLKQGAPDGILTGTGNGGMEESVKFLRQIIDYAEGLLTPGNFVQSIPNAIASQIGLLDHNRGYNSTYVHRGLGFEHALIDAAMLIREKAGSVYLVGGIDELSRAHYHIELADGWYKSPLQPGRSLYDYDSPGSIAGEGAALFLVNGEPGQALAAIHGIVTLHSTDEQVVAARLRDFLEQYLPPGKPPGLFLSGENGDNRALRFYHAAEAIVGASVPVARFKHLCGEYPTASAFALWLALQLAPGQPVPSHLIKRPGVDLIESPYILLYNNHKLTQHSFILLERFR